MGKQSKMLDNSRLSLPGLRGEILRIGRGEFERDGQRYRYEIYTVPEFNNFMVVEEVLDGNPNVYGDIVLRSVIRDPRGLGDMYAPLVRALDDGCNNFVYLRAVKADGKAGEYYRVTVDIFSNIPCTVRHFTDVRFLPYLPSMLIRNNVESDVGQTVATQRQARKAALY